MVIWKFYEVMKLKVSIIKQLLYINYFNKVFVGVIDIFLLKNFYYESMNEINIPIDNVQSNPIEISQSECNCVANGRKSIFIQRQAIFWNDLNSKYGKVKPKSNGFFNIKNIFKPISTINLLVSLFPIASWLPKYSIKNSLLSDVIAGFTISILHIPQGIAYGLLAGVEPVFGLYVSFFPVIIYALMGTSRHISIGTFAIASIMLNNAADKIMALHGDRNDQNDLNNCKPTSIEILTVIGFLSGLMQVLMSVMRLGIVSVVLSDHLVSGFSTGVAFHVATSQLWNLFGFSLKKTPKGAFKLVYVSQMSAFCFTNIYYFYFTR